MGKNDPYSNVTNDRPWNKWSVDAIHHEMLKQRDVIVEKPLPAPNQTKAQLNAESSFGFSSYVDPSSVSTYQWQKSFPKEGKKTSQKFDLGYGFSLEYGDKQKKELNVVNYWTTSSFYKTTHNPYISIGWNTPEVLGDIGITAGIRDAGTLIYDHRSPTVFLGAAKSFNIGPVSVDATTEFTAQYNTLFCKKGTDDYKNEYEWSLGVTENLPFDGGSFEASQELTFDPTSGAYKLFKFAAGPSFKDDNASFAIKPSLSYTPKNKYPTVGVSTLYQFQNDSGSVKCKVEVGFDNISALFRNNFSASGFRFGVSFEISIG